jgi:deazaflavin-dependent oxidoreductase (nitroreductase family)
MWFMNYVANPFVKLILRSPLHGWMSAALLLITYRGRKSGREFTLPVQYVQDGNQVYIIPGFAEKKNWWRNLRGGMDVQVTLKGQIMSGRGILLDHETDAEALSRGFGMYIKQFPSLAKMHNIRVEADGQLNADDVRKAAAAVKIVEVKLKQ